MVHVPAKFRENTSMRFRVTVRKLNVTDGQTDRQTDGRGALQYLPSRAFGAAGDNNVTRIYDTSHGYSSASCTVCVTGGLLKITHMASRKSCLVIICPNSYEKLTKVNSGQIGVGLNIAQNHSSSL